MRLLLAVAAGSALFAADFTYTEKTEITGGSLKKMMDLARKFSRQPAGPTVTTHRIRGNKMSSDTGQSVNIVDLDAESITDVNHEKKEYSVITFAEMSAAMKRASERMSATKEDKSGVEMKWKVSVDTPGDKRTVAGLEARHAVMKLQMEATDKKSGQSGVTDMHIDQWMAKVPGSEAQVEFYKKYAQKMGMTVGPQMQAMLQAGPAGMDAMREAGKKLAEMEGMSVASVVKMMGASGMPEGAAMPDVKPKEEARDAAVGAALGRLGGLGGLGRRKKKEEEPPPQPEAVPAAQQAQGPGVMLEFTTEITSFSSSPVDASAFQAPAGYKQVDHPMKRMAR